MRKTLLTGLALLLPFAITLLILRWVLDLLTDPFTSSVEGVLLKMFPEHQGLILFFSRICVLILLVVFIFILGFLAQKYFFNTLIKGIDLLFHRIPFVGGLYRILKEIVKGVGSSDEKAFKGSVLLPFPSENMKALGLRINDLPLEMPSGEKFSSIFVPTAPHPISGFLLLVPDNSLTPIELSTEEVFKILLSLGLSKPNKN